MIGYKKSLVLMIIIYVLGTLLLGQPRDKDVEMLTEQILTIYRTRQEKGLRRFLKANEKKISRQFIENFAVSAAAIDSRNKKNPKPGKSFSNSDYYKKMMEIQQKHAARIYGGINENKKKLEDLAKALRAGKSDRKSMVELLDALQQMGIIGFDFKADLLEIYDTEGKEGAAQFLKENYAYLSMRAAQMMLAPDEEQIKKMQQEVADVSEKALSGGGSPFSLQGGNAKEYNDIARIMIDELKYKTGDAQVPQESPKTNVSGESPSQSTHRYKPQQKTEPSVSAKTKRPTVRKTKTRKKVNWRLIKDYDEINGKSVSRRFTRSAAREPGRETLQLLGRMKDEILHVYDRGGEQALRRFVKDKWLSRKFIVGFSEFNFELGIHQWPVITKILGGGQRDVFGEAAPLSDDKSKKLIAEIKAVYRNNKEKGLRELVKKNRHLIDRQFVMDFADHGFKKRIRDWWKMAETLAIAIGDRKALWDIRVKISQASHTAREPGEEYSSRKNKPLKEEILAVYYSQKEQGLREFLESGKKKVDYKFIDDFTEAGSWEKKKKWLKITRILAEEKNDQKILAEVDSRIKTYNEFQNLLKETAVLLDNKKQEWGILTLDIPLNNLDFEQAAQRVFARARTGLAAQRKRYAGMEPQQYFLYVAEFFERSMPPSQEKAAFLKGFHKCVEQTNLNPWVTTAELYLEFAAYFGRTMPASEKKTAVTNVLYKFFEQIVLFNLDNKNTNKAFRNAEALRARNFRTRLGNRQRKLNLTIKPGLKQKNDGFVDELSRLQREIYEARRKKDKNKLVKLTETYRTLWNRYEHFLVENRLKPGHDNTESPAITGLSNLKTDELVLSFFIISDKIYVFVISKDYIRAVKLEVPENVINTIITRYFRSIRARNDMGLIKYGKEIYIKLFKPLEPAIRGRKNLIIVPDGELAKIPFESLVTGESDSGEPEYLLERYRLKYIQGISVLSIIRNRKGSYGFSKNAYEQFVENYRSDREFRQKVMSGEISMTEYTQNKKSNTNRFIGFGDPVYDYENFKNGLPEKGADDRNGEVPGRLQGSGEEITAIARLFENQKEPPRIYLRENATEENARTSNMQDFDYIHFSCHGVLDGDFQALVLARIPGAKEDSYITPIEMNNYRYNARLVVLSACQTGKGKIERGEGVTGLTRAVMQAGTGAVVASLWNVSDIGTKELMVRFYRNMLEKSMSKTEALRQAKLEMLRGGTYSSPYYWSPFVMYGE